MDETDRRRELAIRLAAVRARIAGAAVAAGRDPESVVLVVVSKTHPASDVRLLAGLGVSDFGENRDQEASAKAEETSDLSLRWHFIGQVQTNKVRSILRYADVIQSVDRLRLVKALSKAADAAGRDVTCLVQVNLDTGNPAPGGPDPVDAASGTRGPIPGRVEPVVLGVGSAAGAPRYGRGAAAAAVREPEAVEEGASCRGGVAPDGLLELADAVAAAPRLRLGGLMAVAPRGGDARAAFGRLGPLLERVRRDHPEALMLSAGMSGDLEEAVAAGATHVRVGTAILGLRPPLR